MKKLVVTCAVGSQAQRLLSVSGPIFAAYAARIGADYRVIDSPRISPDYPLGAKFQIGQYLRAGWDRLIYLDVDIILSPTCADLFDVVPADSVGIHDESAYLGDPDWARKTYAAIADSQGWDTRRPSHNLNSGVIVCGREDVALFDPPTRTFPKSHTAEQTIINLNAARHRLRLFPLDKRFNYQWWANRSKFDLAAADVYHFSGLSQEPNGDELRYSMMRSTAQRLRIKIAGDSQSTRCRSLGEPISGREAERLGLSLLRTWRPCSQGFGEKGHICGCRPWPNGGCGGCPMYVAAEEDQG